MKKSIFALAAVCVVAGAFAAAQGQRRAPDPRSMGGGDCRDNPYNCADAANPLPTADTVWLEEMTWMDVRDAMKAGKTTAIISTGGIEPNGPWLALGKHNYVLHANCDAIARKLGNALCAPIVKLVPEGDIEPKTGHMVTPGTITMREETFQAVLTDTAVASRRTASRTSSSSATAAATRPDRRPWPRSSPRKWAGSRLSRTSPSTTTTPRSRKLHGRARASMPATASPTACTTTRSSRSTCSSPTRSRFATTSASRPGRRRSTACRWPTGEGHRDGEADRRVPRRADRRGHQQGHRQQGQGHDGATVAPGRETSERGRRDRRNIVRDIAVATDPRCPSP